MGRLITLLQPRHTYAPDEGEGHIYSPTSLWTAASRIIQAGGDVRKIVDANLHPFEPTTDVVGVNVVGVPYIPDIRTKIQTILDPNAPFILGGATIAGLSDDQLHGLFGSHAVSGNNDLQTADVLGINPRAFPLSRETTLIPAYERVPDEDMKKYMEREMSLYLGHGCIQNCDFCAILRKNKPEIYRDLNVVERDVGYLSERAARLGLHTLEFYLSNVDLFQTPEMLGEFASIIQGVRSSIRKTCPDFTIRMRGLSTVTQFLKTHRERPDAIQAMIDAGLHRVGFGIDGGTPEVWRAIGKTHNTEEKCFDAIRVAREEYNLTPEALMVFGHAMETRASLEASVDFTLDMVDLYRAVPRPHVAKDYIPGNKHWANPDNQAHIKYLIQNPQYFQALDFTALPSSISHPNAELRALVAHYYQMIANITGNMTDVIYPIAPEFDEETNARHRRMNIWKYDN